MKICYLGNPMSRHTKRWVKYFVNKGYDISLITTSYYDENPIKGVKIYKLDFFDFLHPKNFVRLVKLFNRLNSTLKQIEPAILHAHQISNLAFFLPFLKFHPHVLSSWGSDVLIIKNESKVKAYLTSYAVKKANLLHCDGNSTWKALEKLGAHSDKIVLIPFGIDTKKFSPEKRSIQFRRKIGTVESLTIISTRCLEPIYDLENLIYAIPKIVRKIPDAKFIIGSTGSLKKKLEVLAKELLVSDNTIFTGRIGDYDFPYYVASADIYVSTSLSDGGLASCTGEAMACGLPVVVTENSDNKDWIKDGVNGFVIPVKNPDILAEKIIKLASDKNLRQKFGKLNRKIIMERNDYLTEMSKMELEYKKLINGRKV